MELGRLRRKYLGCIIGAAVGDAVGAPLEFWDRERLRSHPQGSEWITEMLPFAGMSPHPLGLWRADPPKGTGTDDTRLNQIFVEAVTKYGLQLNARLLAAEYVDRYVNRDQYYPGYHNLSTAQLEPLLAAACGELDMDCPTRPGVPPHVLRAHAGRSGVPIGWGLLCLPSAGLLHPGEPEDAYRHTFEIDFLDIGYARDGTALLAAMVAAGCSDGVTPREAIQAGLAVDPYGFGGTGSFTARTMVERITRVLELADGATSDEEFVRLFSREVQHEHPYSPVDWMGIAVAACYRAEADPRRAILIAVNDRDLDERGEFKRYRDIDCTGSVCGALAGALAPDGIDAIPQDWAAAAISANLDVYGFDIEANAQRLFETVTTGDRRS